MAKVWLITGSARGLGRSIAEAVLAHGDQLVATARNPQQLNDLVQRYGSAVRAVALDVKNRAQADNAVKTAVDAFGRLDVLVNNAGYANIVSIEESTEEEFRDQLETDLWGVIHVTRAALPVMRKQRSGHIVQISSIGGRIGTPGLGAYQTAKWGIEGFSEVLAKEVNPLGIKVLIVEPGGMPTDWAGSSMHISEPGADYQASIGQFLTNLRAGGVRIGGRVISGAIDPAKVARVIINMIDEPNPPLRLLVGSDAVQIALATDEAKLAETRAWQGVSQSTDVERETSRA
jgi:NAD(P)-dependent dehydrogenase (short-subunit alcohol dehydrogenase family)